MQIIYLWYGQKIAPIQVSLLATVKVKKPAVQLSKARLGQLSLLDKLAKVFPA